jgi:hypothetical protein
VDSQEEEAINAITNVVLNLPLPSHEGGSQGDGWCSLGAYAQVATTLKVAVAENHH